jgi:hypothetical protein
MATAGTTVHHHTMASIKTLSTVTNNLEIYVESVFYIKYVKVMAA